MFSINDIRQIDIESINNCNALCPLCLRGEGMSTNDSLDWDRIVEQISSNVWANVKQINFNGTTGDNLMHPRIYDILEWTRSNSSATISVSTNGSVRNTDWWAKLGAMLKGHPHKVVFGIDGMSDTHHLYRIGTNWSKIIDNATAFIKAGGIAEWQFILFDHNKHQIKECSDLASQLGFSRFFTLYQDRFEHEEITTKTGVLRRYDPRDLTSEVVVKESSNSIKKRIGNKTVACRSQQVGWVSIYADGTVWPCCWMMGWHLAKHQKTHYQLINRHFKKTLKIDFDQISLYNNNLMDIINSDLWTSRFPDSFDNDPNPVCIQQCSK